MFSLETPHRVDYNEYIKYTVFNIKRKPPSIIPNLQLWDFFSKGFKNGFETAMVNEPSVFEPLEVFCTVILWRFLALEINKTHPPWAMITLQ